jgi:1-aminocyclopropane-1-carboxylate deaminase/D-cysteine desulfhydrase-like pyridoxal-dependent ACC family enzyme
MIQYAPLKIFGFDAFTPVEEYNGIFYKREDKFMPFEGSIINGGKVRQALAIINKHLDEIRVKYDSTIKTATSIYSPQGIILAKIAQEYSLKCILGVGATKDWSKSVLMNEAHKLGAEIRILSGIGYNTVLYHRLKDVPGFPILFGMNAKTDRDAIIETISNQVINIPRGKFHNLIIPMGSAITTAGILDGLIKFNLYPKNVIAVQIAGYDRMKTIKELVPFTSFINFKQVKYKKYPYQKELIVKFNDTEYLDPVYEAKAYDWMINNIDYKNEKTLFWIVGNTFNLRGKT